MSVLSIRATGAAGLAFVLCLGFGSTRASAAEVIQFRLVEPRTVHLDDENSARSYDKSLKDLGCESRLDGHSGHFDLTYRCPQWRQLELADHASADKWQEWLRSLGFEVGHSH
jgi:hypothetical protein